MINWPREEFGDARRRGWRRSTAVEGAVARLRSSRTLGRRRCSAHGVAEAEVGEEGRHERWSRVESRDLVGVLFRVVEAGRVWRGCLWEGEIETHAGGNAMAESSGMRRLTMERRSVEAMVLVGANGDNNEGVESVLGAAREEEVACKWGQTEEGSRGQIRSRGGDGGGWKMMRVSAVEMMEGTAVGRGYTRVLEISMTTRDPCERHPS